MSAHTRYLCLRPKQLIVGEGIQAANCFHKEALFALFYLRFSWLSVRASFAEPSKPESAAIVPVLGKPNGHRF